MTKGTEIIARFERFASPQLAESWDHSGLQIGNPDQPVHKVMTTLDVRPAVVDEAIDQGWTSSLPTTRSCLSRPRT